MIRAQLWPSPSHGYFRSRREVNRIYNQGQYSVSPAWWTSYPGKADLLIRSMHLTAVYQTRYVRSGAGLHFLRQRILLRREERKARTSLLALCRDLPCFVYNRLSSRPDRASFASAETLCGYNYMTFLWESLGSDHFIIGGGGLEDYLKK